LTEKKIQGNLSKDFIVAFNNHQLKPR